MSVIPHPIKNLKRRRLIATLDEADPIERAFQALVILHPEHLPRTGGKHRKAGAQ